jgi:hypothetical protein
MAHDDSSDIVLYPVIKPGPCSLLLSLEGLQIADGKVDKIFHNDDRAAATLQLNRSLSSGAVLVNHGGKYIHQSGEILD